MSQIVNKINASTPKVMTLGELAEKTGTKVYGDAAIKISGVGIISQAKEGEIAFISEAKYKKYLTQTAASAVIITAKDVESCSINALICNDPKLVYAQVVQLLYPYETVQASKHPSAFVDEGSMIDPTAVIGPNCVIGKRVKIGANVVLQAGCYIGDDCIIGAGTVLFANVTVYHRCEIGQDYVIHTNTVIGSDGFGFAKNRDKWLKVGQIGGVKIGDRVDIGASTTIDRGAIEDTVIGNDVILDNQIQIGHNVKIGDGTAIAACCGIAGSAVIGKHCMIGGGSMILGHLELGNYVNIVGSSNVGQSIAEPGVYASGLTTTDMKTWKRNLVRFHQLDNLAMRLIEIERKLKVDEEIG